jgi:hypothetical protein
MGIGASTPRAEKEKEKHRPSKAPIAPPTPPRAESPLPTKHHPPTKSASHTAARENRGQTRVTGKNIEIRRDIAAPPADAQTLVFKSADGKQICWNLGEQNAEQFCRVLKDATAVLFNPGKGGARATDKVRIFFPYNSDGMALRIKSIPKPVTLRKVIKEIDVTALQVAARMLTEQVGMATVTEAQADRHLKDTAICSLLMRITGGIREVYVTLQVSGRGSMLQAFSGGASPRP